MVWRERESVELAEGEARAADYYPFSEREECVWGTPGGETEKGVYSDDGEQDVGGREGFAQAGEGVDSVVGCEVGKGGVESGRLEMVDGAGGLEIAEQRDHRKAVWIGSGGTVALKRLICRWSEKDAVEPKGLRSSTRHSQVTKVGWVKAAAEEPNAHDG